MEFTDDDKRLSFSASSRANTRAVSPSGSAVAFRVRSFARPVEGSITDGLIVFEELYNHERLSSR